MPPSHHQTDGTEDPHPGEGGISHRRRSDPTNQLEPCQRKRNCTRKEDGGESEIQNIGWIWRWMGTEERARAQATATNASVRPCDGGHRSISRWTIQGPSVRSCTHAQTGNDPKTNEHPRVIVDEPIAGPKERKPRSYQRPEQDTGQERATESDVSPLFKAPVESPCSLDRVVATRAPTRSDATKPKGNVHKDAPAMLRRAS